MNTIKPADWMRYLKSVNALLIILAIFGLIRLWSEGASVSYVLTFVYIIVALVMIVPAVVRSWMDKRKGVPENNHKRRTVRSILVQVFGISTVYCLAAVAICIFHLNRNGLAVFYAVAAVLCGLVVIKNGLKNRKLGRADSTQTA